jgi:VWFA-related protein
MLASVIWACAAVLSLPAQTPTQPPPSSGQPASQTQPPQTQPTPPVFRAGIDLLTVDATALDSNGRQVTDLTTSDFTVDVDGARRQVVSAEYIRLVDPRRPAMTVAERRAAEARAEAALADGAYFSTNDKGAPPGRLILILVDQGNIRTGQGRPTMDSARKFVDTLQPEDRVGVLAVPPPGEAVDFTTRHDRVKESLLRIVGTANYFRRRFNISLTEAIALYQNSDARLALEVVVRECGTGLSTAEAERCEREVEQEAAELVAQMRQQAEDSIRSMRDIFKTLGTIEGQKQVILISEGLILEHLTSDVDDLAAVAADSRISLDVMMLDVPRFDAAQAQRPTTPREDRDLQEEGLLALSGLARGNLYRIATTAEFAFERIGRGLDGYYLLGVEARPTDRNGRRHSVSVKTTRRGVTLRSRRSFLPGISARASSPADAVSRALRSPLPSNDLPVRLSTWTYKEPGSSKVRVLTAAEVERIADQSLAYTTGMAVVDRGGKAMLPPVEERSLVVAEGDPSTAVWTSAVVVEPGTYTLRVALADSEGRVGTVDRRVDAWQVDAKSVAVGDLVLGGYAGGPRPMISPAVEPRVSSGQMLALAEVYAPDSAMKGIEGTLDVLQEETGAPLASVPMVVAAGTSPEIAAVNALVPTSALPPGQYLARATIREGGKARGHMTRPFRVVPGASTPSASLALAPTANLPPEFVSALAEGIAPFDRRELLAPAFLAPVYGMADARGAAARAALAEARAGQLGDAAMTAFNAGDQALAAFLKGLDLLGQGQHDRAAAQFQSAMQQAPQFTPARLYLGVTLADARRHKDAAGLLHGAITGALPSSVARAAGEEWIRAGQPALAIEPLRQAAAQPNADARTKKALGIALVLGQRAGEAVGPLTAYLAQQPADQAVLVAGVYAVYTKHLNGADAATLATDRGNAATWAKAYASTKGPMRPLVTAWIRYLEQLK